MVIPLKVEGFGSAAIFPALISDGSERILVDACYPLQSEMLSEALAAEGFRLGDITKILITHQDLDHIGCVCDIKKAADHDVPVFAHRIEAPYLDGSKTPIKLADALAVREPSGEDLARIDLLQNGFRGRSFPVDHLLEQGDILPFCGGIEVMLTPGHTYGHACYLALADRVLISGDALNNIDGRLSGPNPVFTKDMGEATASLRQLLNRQIDAVFCYHGGPFRGDVRAAVESILSE